MLRDDQPPWEVVIETDLNKRRGTATIRIARWSFRQNELHRFVDASGRTYAACIYTVAPDSHKPLLRVVKTKVAPLKTQSAPRLEFCATLVETRLFQSVIKSIARMPVVIGKPSLRLLQQLFCFYCQKTSRWSTFVSNRIKGNLVRPHFEESTIRNQFNKVFCGKARSDNNRRIPQIVVV